MALLFADGFDHYDSKTHLLAKGWTYSATPLFVSASRHGVGQSLHVNYDHVYAAKGFPARQTIIVGFGYYCKDYFETSNWGGWGIMYGGTHHLFFKVNTGTGTITAKRGNYIGTTIGESEYAMKVNTWYYIEIKAKISNTVGTLDLKINGKTVITFSGDTAMTTELTDAVWLYGNDTTTGDGAYYDDVYICDDQGGANDDFLGDVYVEALLPDGAGNYSQFTPSGEASNYLCVDESPTIDEDTTYVGSNVSGEKDTYTFADASVGTITAVQLALCGEAETGGRDIKGIMRTGGADYYFSGEHTVPGGDYSILTIPADKNPNGDIDWTVSDLNAAELGFGIST